MRAVCQHASGVCTGAVAAQMLDQGLPKLHVLPTTLLKLSRPSAFARCPSDGPLAARCHCS